MGMNDLARMQCSEEVVLMGILRVVEEIRMKKPDAKIVINSLLPMTDVRSGAFPLQNDYKDAFRNNVDIPTRRGFRIFGPRAIANIDSSHIAHKPSKAIQGEKEEDGDGDAHKGRGSDKFPKALRTRRLARKKSTAKLTPEQKRQAEVAEKRAKMQELLKKRQAFMDKKLAQRLKNDKVNPIMRDKTTYKRRDPKKLFVQQSETPLWPSINVINNNLRRFAEKHDHVSFFDATEIFASRSGRGAWILKSDMISVRGHPTEDGFRAWEDAVSAKLKYMHTKPKIGTTGEQPGNVLPAGNPVVPESKPVPQAPQTPPMAPKFPSKEQPEDEISESELSNDESRDDDKKASGDDAKKTSGDDAKEEDVEEEESGSADEEVEEDSGSEDDQADESESQDADNSAQSGEEEEDDESGADVEEDGNESKEEEKEEADSSEEEEKEAATAKKPATKKVVSSSAAKAAAKETSKSTSVAKEKAPTKTTSTETTKKASTKKTVAKPDSEE